MLGLNRYLIEVFVGFIALKKRFQQIFFKYQNSNLHQKFLEIVIQEILHRHI